MSEYIFVGRNMMVNSKENETKDKAKEVQIQREAFCDYCGANAAVAIVGDTSGYCDSVGYEHPHCYICNDCMNLYCNKHGTHRYSHIEGRSGCTDFVCVGCASIRFCDFCDQEYKGRFDQICCSHECEQDYCRVEICLQGDDISDEKYAKYLTLLPPDDSNDIQQFKSTYVLVPVIWTI